MSAVLEKPGAEKVFLKYLVLVLNVRINKRINEVVVIKDARVGSIQRNRF